MHLHRLHRSGSAPASRVKQETASCGLKLIVFRFELLTITFCDNASLDKFFALVRFARKSFIYLVFLLKVALSHVHMRLVCKQSLSLLIELNFEINKKIFLHFFTIFKLDSASNMAENKKQVTLTKRSDT